MPQRHSEIYPLVEHLEETPCKGSDMSNFSEVACRSHMTRSYIECDEPLQLIPMCVSSGDLPEGWCLTNSGLIIHEIRDTAFQKATAVPKTLSKIPMFVCAPKVGYFDSSDPKDHSVEAHFVDGPFKNGLDLHDWLHMTDTNIEKIWTTFSEQP